MVELERQQAQQWLAELAAGLERWRLVVVSGSDLFNPDFVALARAYGWQAERVDHTAAFEPAFARALASGQPTLLHLKLDADVITSRTTLTAIRQAAQAQGR